MSLDPAVGFRFRITHPGGRPETLMVDAERALIGSAAHCEVRLDPELVAHEHLEIYSHAGTVYFATRPYGLQARLPALEGTTAVEGQWAPGSTLAIGNVQMTVELVDIGMAKAKPPYWMLVLIVPALLLTIVVVALARAPRHTDPFIPEAPALLLPKDTTSCRTVPADQRSALAMEKQRIALAKRERSPFSPQDGAQSVVYYETAVACFRAAAMEPEAAAAELSADALRAKLEEDYRVRRVRLEHAYRVGDAVAMKRELVVLVPMLAERRGPYTDWLGAVDRMVTIELNNRGKGVL